MITLQQLKAKTFHFYAVLTKYGYNHFSNTLELAQIYGYEESDFIKLEVSIEDEINITKKSDYYNGKLCGYYKYTTDELSGAYIYNSLHQTYMCFPAGLSKHKVDGLFVVLEVKET